jgi:RND family efflux transporter MFP subunit
MNTGAVDRTLPAIGALAMVGLALLVASPVHGASQDALGSIVAVATREWQRTYVADGVVEAVREATIAPQVAGRIVMLAVRAGDRVRAGQVLVRIDARAAEQAVAASAGQIAETEASVANARRRHERNRALLARGFVSQAAVDQTQSELAIAQAQLDAARAAAAQAATAQTFTVLTAPLSGIVGATDAQVGDMAIPGKPLLNVFDPGELRVTATLPQAVLAKVDLKQPVAVELASTERHVIATRAVLVPVADSRSHASRVRLALPDAAEVLPGQYARAQFVIGTERGIAVPAQALVRRGEVSAVYVVDEQGSSRLRLVRFGEAFDTASGTLVPILAGLREGERIALDPVRAGMASTAAP